MVSDLLAREDFAHLLILPKSIMEPCILKPIEHAQILLL